MTTWNGSRLPTIQGKTTRCVGLIVMCFTTLLYNSIQCVDVKPQRERYVPNYNVYHNLTRLDKEVEYLSKFSNYVKVYSQYKSRQNRPQYLLHFSDFRKYSEKSEDRTEKIRILFSFGEHAREFLPVESAIFLLRNLTAGLIPHADTLSRQFTQQVLSRVDLYIILMANPDGRRYVEQTENYCWRGTSTGVDLDRNFGWEFGGKGSSSDPEDEEYRGTHPFSESESVVFQELTSDVSFDAFFSFHSGINQIYIPYSDTKSRQLQRVPDNLQEMYRLAARLSRCTKYRYRFGTSHQLINYTADGTIFDYMAGVQKIPFSFTVELWGKQHHGLSCFDLFNPESHELQKVVRNLHPLYINIIQHLWEWKARNLEDMANPNSERPSMVLGYMLLGITVSVSAMVCLHRKLRNCPKIYQHQRIVSLKTLSSSFPAKSL